MGRRVCGHRGGGASAPPSPRQELAGRAHPPGAGDSPRRHPPRGGGCRGFHKQALLPSLPSAGGKLRQAGTQPPSGINRPLEGPVLPPLPRAASSGKPSCITLPSRPQGTQTALPHCPGVSWETASSPRQPGAEIRRGPTVAPAALVQAASPLSPPLQALCLPLALGLSPPSGSQPRAAVELPSWDSPLSAPPSICLCLAPGGWPGSPPTLPQAQGPPFISSGCKGSKQVPGGVPTPQTRH